LPPFHPENTDPAAGVAVSVTGVPWSNWSVQLAPQLIPELTPRGEDVTVPVPVPFLVTVTVNGAGVATVKVAVTIASTVS
jgi:hypothetical protein